MSNFLPFLIKMILWGSLKDNGAKKAPIALRVLLGIILTVFWIGLTALLIYVGLADQKGLLTVLGVFCLISVPLMVVLEIKMKKDS